MVTVASWGRLEHSPHDVHVLTNRAVAGASIRNAKPGLPLGMARSYGDVCLNPGGTLWQTTRLDRYLSFDEITGRLVCEAGVLLKSIQDLAVPRGWMLAVSPGTQFVTVGGAIANDVHGKNHHTQGCFADHVLQLRLIRTDGSEIECGPSLEPDWFQATVGGLGLTGLIITATLQLRRVESAWLDTETVPYANLEQFFALADEAEADWEHTVSWIDCLSGGVGRGLFMRANHAGAQQRPEPSRRQFAFALVPPVSLVNRLTLRPFNAMYYALHRSAGRSLMHYQPFFYPLDRILHWNRMYGPKGFYQYQSLIPRANGLDATRAMLDEVARMGHGSFLAVLKTFGDKAARGMMSFAAPGVTLALDFPNQGTDTERLFARLDAIVLEAGGRVYLAKDARMPRALFEAGYPRLAEFLRYRDPGITSAMSRRLIGS